MKNKLIFFRDFTWSHCNLWYSNWNCHQNQIIWSASSHLCILKATAT